MHFAYPIGLTSDRKDRGFIVRCRDIPEATTQGDAVEQALTQAEGALQAAIEGRIEDGLDIPTPSAPKRGEQIVAAPITTARKAAVYISLREQGESKSELARRMGAHEKEARRMLDPHQQTKVPTLERALAVLGRRATLAVR